MNKNFVAHGSLGEINLSQHKCHTVPETIFFTFAFCFFKWAVNILK